MHRTDHSWRLLHVPPLALSFHGVNPHGGVRWTDGDASMRTLGSTSKTTVSAARAAGVAMYQSTSAHHGVALATSTYPYVDAACC